MSRKTTFELRTPVTPYVSSTPLDFSEERQFLSHVVFPKLNDLCQSRGAYFRPCDLHWKPGDEKTQEGLLLKTCLDAIKHCSPFFLCLLGETYGPFRDDSNARLVLPKNNGKLDIPQEFDWLDKNLVLAGSGGHSWVLQEGNQYKSITELEVTQGALTPESLYVTLYYRRSDHLDRTLVLGSDNMPGKDPDISIYSSESEQAKLKIHDLRQRLVNKGVPVKFFSTLEELEKLVLEDWMEVIDLCLPPLLHDMRMLDTADYKEWLDQQAFLNRCSGVFVSTPDVEDILKQLTEFASTCTRDKATYTDHDILLTSEWSNDNHSIWASVKSKKDQTSDSRNISIMLINGDRGVGMSTLAAHWLNEFRVDNPHICVISHFVAASYRSMDVVYFLKYCTRKLRQQFLLSEVYNPSSLCATIESDIDNADDSLLSVSEAFVAAISQGPCVILLDGVNELNSDKQFDWLPEFPPATCRLIFTSTSSDISHHCLSQRPDTTVVNLPASLKNPSTTVAMIKEHFPTLRDLIGEKAITRLTQLKLMQTALGSKIIGCELVCFRGYSNMNTFMEEYAEVWSLRDFWTMCVQNWVKEHSWTLKDPPPELNFTDGGFCYSGWVVDCLCLIVLSRNGLTQEQILSVLKMIGYDGDLEVTSYEWLQFRHAASATLQETGNGQLVFGHKYIQEIAEYLLFKSITSCSHDPVDIMRTVSISRRQLYHTYLARYFSQQMLNIQILQELPWHLMFSGDIINLVNYLTSWNGLLKLMSDDSDVWLQDLTLYWSVCQSKGYHPDMIYLKLMHDVGVVDINDIQALEDKYSQARVISSMERVTTSTPVFSKPNHKDEMQQTRGEFQDGIYVCGGADKAVNKKFSDSVFVTQSYPGSRDQQSTLTDRQQMNSVSDVASLGWFLAKFLERINQREASTILLSSLIHYIQQKCSQTTQTYILVSRCHHSVGQFHETSDDLEAADKEYKLALHAVMAAINLDDEMIYEESTQYLKGLLLNCHGSIRIHKGQYSEAAELLEEAADCVRDNSDCIVLKSAIFYNLGLVCYCQYSYIHAEIYLRESVRLGSRWFGWCHPLVVDALLALAKLLADPNNTQGQDLRQAKSLYKRTLRVHEIRFGVSHPSVASVLYELGTLLAEENSRLAKLEAQDCLRRSLDIRTTHLGSTYPCTVETQRRLTKVNVALQLRNYEFGSVKYDVSSFTRSDRKPFSATTLPESGLLRMFKKDKRSTSAHSDDTISVWSRSHEGLMNQSRPESIVSTMLRLTSASERLLSAPLTEMPRLLQRKKQSHSSQGLKQHITAGSDENHIHIKKDESDKRVVMDNDLPQFNSNETINQTPKGASQYASMNDDAAVNVDENAHKNQPITADIQQKVDRGNVSKETSQEMLANLSLDSYTEVIGTQKSDEEKKIVSPHPSSAPHHPSSAPHHPSSAPHHPSSAPHHPSSAPHHPSSAPHHPSSAPHHPSSAPHHPSSAPHHPSSAPHHPSSVPHHPSSAPHHPSSAPHQPSSAPQRLLQRCRKYSLTDRPQSCITKGRNNHNLLHRLWSGRSSVTTASSYSSRHLSHCHIPGRHDITAGNIQSISGPHSGVTSLLGDPPCPRQTSSILHHMSAWYHVPGRYGTTQHPYPRKRMQRTKTSKEMESYVTLKPQNSIAERQETQQGQENITNQSDKENHMFNGTYMLHSENTTFSSKDNFSVHPRFALKQNSARSLMVSGLEIPRSGHPEHSSVAQNRVVKFQKNIVIS